MACWNSGNGGSTASTDAVVLGFRFAVDTERERERNPRERREELVRELLIYSRGSGLDGNGEGEGWRSTARSLQAPGKTTVLVFQLPPCTSCLSFLWVLFSFIFLFLYLLLAVLHLIEVANELQIL